LEVVKPLKVIACICGLVGVILTVIAITTAHWLEATGFSQGLWEYCVIDSRASDAVEKCTSTTDKVWIVVCTALCIAALVTSAIASLLACIGLCTNQAKRTVRRAFFCAAASIMFFALASLLAAVILYPIMFISEISDYRNEFNISQWFFSWSYGVAWGAAIFLFGSAVLLAIGRETQTVMYREKSSGHK
jgi:hypothetical protein